MTAPPLVSPLADAPPRVKRAIFAAAALVAAGGTLGTAFFPYLGTRHPLVLLALAPKYLTLVGPRVDFAPAVLLVAARGLFGMLTWYGLGGLWGHAAVARVGARSARARAAVGWVERNFRAWELPLVLAFPGVLISLIAGSAGMPFRRFVLAGALGQLVWTAVFYRFSLAISAVTSRLTGFLSAHLAEASAVFLLAAVLQRLIARARRERVTTPSA